ncbi:hypothetical protein CLAIMM_00123 [Cladophialophora immunda]|nr:hypothetical protein CLAIMM_00123 [Cladophialophora immunda]
MANIPTFEELPEKPGLPKGCAWGLWDKPTARDELGSLNLLTDDTTSLAFLFSIDSPWITLLSTTWDGLRHAIHKDTGKLYNGVDKEEIIGPHGTDVLGINKWHEKGGIVGRGILIDFVAFAERHNIKYSPIRYYPISYGDLELAAREQNLDFKQGDILLIRSGLVKWYNECVDLNERDAFFTDPNKEGAGVSPTPGTVTWVWDHHFSAVAGDALAWESMPYPKTGLCKPKISQRSVLR